MPTAITDYGQDYYLGCLFGRSFTPPTQYWVALSTQIPDPSTDGTMLGEPSTADGYARVNITNNGTVFGTPTGGVIANIVTISFGVVTTADWPVIKSYALCDAPTNGNVYLYGTLRVPRAPQVGHEVSFDPGLLAFFLGSLPPTIIPAA